MGDMKKNILRKGTVLGIIMLFLGISIIPNITGDVGNKKEDMQINEQKSTSSSTTDWWPMFGHDPSHTRYSSSTTPDTCYLLWNITLGYYEWLHSSPAVADGKVYIASYRGIVYCLSADTGAKIWSYTTGSVVVSSPAVADGKVYIASYDNKVYCLNADTGAKIWSYTTGSTVYSSPVVADGKVYIGSDDNKVYCLNADTGAKIWENTTDRVVSSPAVADGKVYISTYYGIVCCLNAGTGEKIWDNTLGGVSISSPAVADGKVYIGYFHNVYCLNAGTGAKIWSYTTGDDVESSPAVADGKVYIGSDDNKVYCLNADTGAKIWSYTTGSRVESSPAVADGKVYIGSDDHNVYCLNADTGAKIWDYTTGSIVFSGPVVADGKVYLGSYYDMGVYCFGEGGGNHHTKANWGDDGQFGDDGWVYLQYINNKHKYILSTNTAKASNQAFLWLALPIESTSWASVGIKYIPQKTGEAYIIMQGDYSGFIYMALLNLGGGDGWVDISLHVVEKDLYIPEVNEGETYQIFYYQAEVSFRSFDDEFLVPSKGLSIYFQEGIEYLIYLKVKTHIAINKGPGTHTSTGLYWVDFASRGTFFSLPLYNNHVKFSSIDIQYV